MARVILAMAFLPSTRSQFLMSGLTLVVILISYEVRTWLQRRRGRFATALPTAATLDTGGQVFTDPAERLASATPLGGREMVNAVVAHQRPLP